MKHIRYVLLEIFMKYYLKATNFLFSHNYNKIAVKWIPLIKEQKCKIIRNKLKNNMQLV